MGQVDRRVQAAAAAAASALLVAAFVSLRDPEFPIGNGLVASLFLRPARAQQAAPPSEQAQTWDGGPPARDPAPSTPSPARAGPRAGRAVRPGAALTPRALLPVIWRLRPYTAKTHYLSYAGYLRYLYHEKTGRWITLDQASSVVGTKER